MDVEEAAAMSERNSDRYQCVRGFVAQADPLKNVRRRIELVRQGKRAEARALIAEDTRREWKSAVRQVAEADEAAIMRLTQ
jgi:hypothetical protein